MTKQTINIGTVANDGLGDNLRVAFDKVNDNFDEVYITSPTSNIKHEGNSITSTDTDGHIILDPNGTGQVQIVSDQTVSGFLTTTGNVTGGNIAGTRGVFTNVVGTLETGVQTGITSVGTLGALAVTGNVTGGNLLTGAQVIATGNVTGSTIIGTNLSGTLETASQGNITTVGTLGALTVTANITGGNLITGGLVVATGNVTGGNLITGGLVVATGNITGGNVAGTRGLFTNVAGTLETETQTAITSVGTLGALAVTANITGGNLLTGAQVIATGNVTGAYIIGDGSELTNVVSSPSPAGLTTQVQFNDGGTTGADAGLTYVKATDALTATGNVTGGNLITGAQVIATGNVTGGNLITGAQVIATGNVTGGNLITAGLVSAISFAKTGVDGTGNIGQSDNAFNTVHATATSAQYADLAENYEADKQYEPGTILAFGGEKEVTCADTTNTQAIAGIVSTSPAHLMNSQCEGEHVIALALTGRVPCKVIGPIQKGEMVVISQQKGIGTGGGLAPLPGSVVGKSLEYIPEDENTVENPTVHVIEVVVGRL